jgi:hypothetical protein
MQNNFLLVTVYPSHMGKTIEAEYIARENILKLAQPLRGVADHAKVSIEVKEASATSDQPWLALAGSLGEQEGRELARAVRDAFGRDEIEV